MTGTALSTVQEGMWLAEIAVPGTPTFNLPLALSWTGSAHVDALAAALRTVVQRHQILRTRYRFAGEEPVQVVAEHADMPWEVVDLTGAAPPVADEQAMIRAAMPFDIAEDLPLRATLWRRAPVDDLVLLTAHHIAADGWGLTLLLGELAEVYAAHVRGREPDLPPPALQYADFALRNRAVADLPATRRMVTERAGELRAFRPDHPFGAAPPRDVRRGRHDVFTVPDKLRIAIRRLAATLRTTPFTVLLSAFQEVLARRTGTSRFLLGTPMANRPDTSAQSMVGCCTNLVPLRCEVNPQWTFDEVCHRTAGEMFGALGLRHVPYHELVANGAPPVTVTCGLHAMPNGPSPWRQTRYLPTGTAKADLSLLWEDDGRQLTGTLEHDVDRCLPPVVHELRDDLLALLTDVAAARQL